MHKIYTARGAPLPPAVLEVMCSRRADRAGSGLILTAVSAACQGYPKEIER